MTPAHTLDSRELLVRLEKQLSDVRQAMRDIRDAIPREPDPRHDRLEWEGLIGRRAITLAVADTIREEIADLAGEMLPGVHCDRTWALLPWCDLLMQLAELPADPQADFAADVG